MELVSIISKDVHTVIDFSLTEVEQILDFLDICIVQLGDKTEQQKEAVTFVTDTLYKNLTSIVEELHK